MQKFSDDTAIVACIREGEEGEYRGLVNDFVEWCQRNKLQLNTAKTKELVLDFRRVPPTLQPINISRSEVEVSTYKYLGLQLDNSLSWAANMDAAWMMKAQSRIYFLRRLLSFNVSALGFDMISSFQQSTGRGSAAALISLA